MPPCTLAALLAQVRRRLAQADLDDPGLEGRLIVEHFTHTARADAIASPEMAVEQDAAERALAAAERRCAGMPVHRILGYRDFYGLRLKLSPATLEPRPDTEALVELVLPEARRIVEARGRCRILDLGTGTGAIALALLSTVPAAEATGVDISPEALETAAANADMNGYPRRFFALRSDWFDDVEGRFDLIVSNPPYIATVDLEMLDREVRDHDPRAALDGGADGLEAYRRIATGARAHLECGGAIAVETGYDQKDAVAAIFAAQGYRIERSARDLGGRDRAMMFAPSNAK